MAATLTEKIIHTIRPQRGRYTRLDCPSSPTSLAPSNQYYRRIARWAALIIPIWLFLLYINSKHLLRTQPVADNHIESAFAHLVIQANAGTTSFCRTLYSSAALGYPTPRIINWGKKFEDPTIQDGGKTVANIESVRDFLNSLDESHDDELVILIDGNDTWFQLRPEVLLQRYFALNQRALKRIWPRYGLMYEQSIVFAAQRHCENDEDSWACTAVPPSTLPDNIYGKDTDRLTDDVMNAHTHIRPKYLNTGMAIGPVGRLRYMYEYAHMKLESNNTYAPEQKVFSEIFGEQEYFKEMVMASTNRIPEGPLAKDPRNGLISGDAIELPCDQCQFAIGLDYENELSMPTIYSESHLTQTSADNKLPEDIRSSTPPYWTPDYSGNTNLPEKTWVEVPLLADKDTHTIPVAIHHPIKSNSAHTWNQQWYTSHLRELVDGHSKSFRIPFAVLRNNDGRIQEYWGRHDGYGGVRLHTTNGTPAGWMQWDEVCVGKEVGNEVFTDGKGPYQCPVYFLYWNAQLQEQQLDKWRDRAAKEEEGEDRRSRSDET